MSLPVWAEGDERGYSTYPEGLIGGGNSIIHIHATGAFCLALCGSSGDLREYIGFLPNGERRRIKVCPACRRLVER